MEQNFDIAPVNKAVRDLLAGFNQEQGTALKQIAAGQERRTALLAEAEKRLVARFGDEDPRVLSLRAQLAGAEELTAELASAATRRERLSGLRENERLIHGHIADPDGKPLAGLRVRVFDRDHKFDDLLGDTTTDELGDFAIVYHDRDFAEVREAKPELFIMVEDARGQPLFSSRDKVTLTGSRIDSFQIVLPPAGRQPPTRAPRTRRPTG
jgi:hypothetical protein